MADSDGEYVGDMSDDELDMNAAGNNGDSSHGTRSKGTGGTKRKDGRRKKSARAWEEVDRTWEQALDARDGNLRAADFLDAEKRRRLQRDTTALQRGIVRHLVLVLDMSFAMTDKDLLPNRYNVTLRYAVDFVREYFEQNPISQMAVIGIRDGLAIRISDMSGNPDDHIDKLREYIEEQEPAGNPSLQNALQMCLGILHHLPTHGTREVLVVYGALMTSDPGDIHTTITSLVEKRIRVSMVGLAGHVRICAHICARTNEIKGASNPYYKVALNEGHFREILLAFTTPPATRESDKGTASLLMMGFPSRAAATGTDNLSLCACHSQPSAITYACTRCAVRVCRLPAECPSCGLTLVLSTHLARSYHHLFPLPSWVEVPWADARRSVACYACLERFPVPPANPSALARSKGVSESGRYACPVCGNHFCVDCDVYVHEVIHNCPGCQSDPKRETEGGGGAEAAGGMDIDI